MDSILKKIATINKLITQEIPGLNNIGLFHGKIGLCIYFFHLAKQTKDKEHQKLAEKLIDEVYSEVSQNQPPLDFENGLAGIAWGIEHLVQNNFVDANTDQILSNVDDRIYSHIVTQKELTFKNLTGYMIFIISRLRGKNLYSPDDTSIFIFKRLLQELVNQLGQLIEGKEFAIREPKLFRISWNLPVLLTLLAKLRVMNFYTYKIDHLLNYLSHPVLSFFPNLTSNKLYLLFAIDTVLQQIDLSGWKAHANLLIEHIAQTKILENGLRNKNICFNDGVAGISFISRQLYEITKDKRILLPKKKIAEKIIHSEYWNLIENDKAEKKNVGLFTGIAGVGMELLQLTKNQTTAKQIDTVSG
jgi:hypothetical protein